MIEISAESTIDKVVPPEKWEFNEDVANCFEDMLSRSIPDYDRMRQSSVNLVSDIIGDDRDNFYVLDLGCSDGLMLQALYDRLGGRGYYTGVDVSEPMLKKAKFRFLDQIIEHKVCIQNLDLRKDFPNGIYDAITAILTIQFVPMEYRQHIIQKVYDRLSTSGGVFIMVEKVLGNTDKINELMVKEYYDLKRENGYDQEAIDRKKASLEGVLVPVTNDWNISLLKQAGFRQVDVFWRWMNFVGYIAIK